MSKVIRIIKNENYSVISNIHLREKEMSLKAKGLLSVVLSLPQNWKYSIEGLVSICAEGESAITATLKELKKFGYFEMIKKNPNETESGRYEYEYVFYELPQEQLKQDAKKQGVENLCLEIQGVENQGQLNIYNQYTYKSSTDNIFSQSDSENDLKSFMDKWNVSCENINGYLSGKLPMIDFKALDKYMELSTYLKTDIRPRYIEFYINNYKKIITGFYSDKKRKNEEQREIDYDFINSIRGDDN